MHHPESSKGGNLSDEVVAPVHHKRKAKSQNGAKKSKGSLRRRMTSIFTSPVHLFRRYVLRKRPKRCTSKEEVDTNGGENVVESAALEVAKERNVPCYLLFLGLEQAGKSTTISKLFNEKRPTPYDSKHDPSIKVYSNTAVGQDIGLRVVDTPGLCGREPQDAELVSALSSFLKQDLSHRIPTVTFIVARLDADDDDDDDEDDAGTEQSQFSRMLKTLSQAENLITDHQYSNLALLLTHSQKASNVSARVTKYQQDFAKVFPVSHAPIPAIVIDNIRYNHGKAGIDKFQRTYHDIIFEGLKDIARKRHEHSLNYLIDWFTGKPKRFSVAFQQKLFPLESLSKYPATLPEKNVIPEYEPYFVMRHMENVKRKKSPKKDKLPLSQPQQLLTCLSPGSQIVLADKSLISIDKCLVGDKVLGLDGASHVITGKRKANVNEIAPEGACVGSIYCAAVPNEGGNEQTKPTACQFIYMHANDTFQLVEASKANVPERATTECIYLVELDSLKATIVVNGFPCYAKVDGSINNSASCNTSK